MSTEEPTVVVESVPEPVAAEPAEEKEAVDAGGKTKKAKEPKPKKVAAPRSRNPPAHPPYEEMIKDAIVTLKERTGSSQYAITKFIEEKYKQLPSNFRKIVLLQSKKLVAAEKLVKVKGSFKLPSVKSSAPKASGNSAPAKKPAAAKPKAKPAAKPKETKSIKAATKARPKPKAVAKAKPKAAAKSKTATKPKAAPAKPKAAPAKPKAAASKPKAAAAKPKAAARPKPKERPAKASRTSTRTSPGKKAPAPKAAPKKAAVTKKAPAKGVKPKSVKSPAKKASAKRGRK